MNCTCCNNELDEEESESPRMDGDNIVCDDCYREEYEESCEICDNYFDKPNKPIDHYFIIPMGLIKGMGGLYQVKEYPFYFGDCLSGFDDFFHQNIELIRKIDINSILRTLRWKHACIDQIVNVCPDCVEKYTKTSGFAAIRNRYLHHKVGIDKIITERGIYQTGGLR